MLAAVIFRSLFRMRWTAAQCLKIISSDRKTDCSFLDELLIMASDTSEFDRQTTTAKRNGTRNFKLHLAPPNWGTP
jgi:hypothetical protein